MTNDTETIRLSIIHTYSGREYRSELIKDCIKLDEETWIWLKGAFLGIGFDAESVKEFFDGK